MDKYVIKGGNRLTGEVNISGAKNAAVAIIPAVILADAPCRLENLPDISDVKTLLYIMDSMGARVDYLDRHTVEIDPRPVSTDTVDADVARRIRASYYFLGALLGRYHKAAVPLPVITAALMAYYCGGQPVEMSDLPFRVRSIKEIK